MGNILIVDEAGDGYYVVMEPDEDLFINLLYAAEVQDTDYDLAGQIYGMTKEFNENIEKIMKTNKARERVINKNNVLIKLNIFFDNSDSWLHSTRPVSTLNLNKLRERFCRFF